MSDLVFRETEIGSIPADWELNTLDGVAEKPQYGLTATARTDPVGPKFLRITDIQEDGVDWDSVPYCEATDDEIRKCRLRNGDLVVARIGATTGKTYLISDPPEAVFASYLIRIRTRSEMLPDFLNMFTKSRLYWNQVDEAKGGRLKQGVNIPNLQGLLVPIPALSEQKAIAHVLRTVRQAKEATAKVIAAARQLKASLMRHLFTYGPVPFAEADQAELRETEVGRIPDHWQVLPVRDVAELASGGTPSKSRPDFWVGSIPWASPKDIKQPRLFDVEDHISEEAAVQGSRVVPAGSLFIVIRGMILAKDLPVAMAMRPMAFNQDMKAILPSERVNAEYLLYCLTDQKHRMMPEIGTSAHGTKRIGTSAITEFLLPVPPLGEQ